MLKRNRKVFGILISIMLVIVLMSSLILSSCSKRKDTKIEDGKKLVGFDIELAQAVSKELGMHFHSSEIVWKNKILDVKSNKIDAIWNGMTLTKELQENKDLTFSQPYMKNEQVIIVKKELENNFKTLQDIKNADKVIVESGSAGEKTAKEVNKIDESKIDALEKQADAIANVLVSADKRVAIVDALYGEFLINNESSSYKGKLVSIKVDGFVAEEENYAIGFSKLNEYLKYNIEKALFNLQEKGKLQEIAKKYGVEKRILTIKNPGEKTEKNFDAKSVKRYKEIKEKDKGFFIGYTLYEPMAYLQNK